MQKKAILLAVLMTSSLFLTISSLFLPKGLADYQSDPAEPNDAAPYDIRSGSAHTFYGGQKVGEYWYETWEFSACGLNMMADVDAFVIWVDIGCNVSFTLEYADIPLNMEIYNTSGNLDGAYGVDSYQYFEYPSAGDGYGINFTQDTDFGNNYLFNVTVKIPYLPDQFEENDNGAIAKKPLQTFSDSYHVDYNYSMLTLTDDDWYNYTVDQNDLLILDWNSSLYDPTSFIVNAYNESQGILSANEGAIQWDMERGYFFHWEYPFNDIDHSQDIQIQLSFSPSWPEPYLTEYSLNVQVWFDGAAPPYDPYEDNDFGNEAYHLSPTFTEASHEDYNYSQMVLLDNDWFNYTVDVNDLLVLDWNTTWFNPPSFHLIIYNESQQILYLEQTAIVYDALKGWNIHAEYSFADIDHMQEIQVYLSYDPNWPLVSAANYTLNVQIWFDGAGPVGGDDPFEDNDYFWQAKYPGFTYDDSFQRQYYLGDLNLSDVDWFNYTVSSYDRINVRWNSSVYWPSDFSLILGNASQPLFQLTSSSVYWDSLEMTYYAESFFDVTYDTPNFDVNLFLNYTPTSPSMRLYDLNVTILKDYVGSPGAVDDGWEPNNSQSEAKYPTASYDDGTTVEYILYDLNFSNPDYFNFSVEPYDYLEIRVQNASLWNLGGMNLMVSRADGSMIIYNDTYAYMGNYYFKYSTYHFTSIAAPEAISVALVLGTASMLLYNLQVTITHDVGGTWTPGVDDTYEDNNIQSEASILTPTLDDGYTVEYDLGGLNLSNADWYNITVQPFDFLWVYIHNQSLWDLTGIRVWVVSQNGTNVFFFNDGSKAWNAGDSHWYVFAEACLGWLTQEETWSIHIDASMYPMDIYALNVSLEHDYCGTWNPCSDDEFESNDARASATSLTRDGISHSESTSGDVVTSTWSISGLVLNNFDYYQIYLNASCNITVTFSGFTGLAHAELQDAGGVTKDSMTGTSSITLSYNGIESSGTYYVLINPNTPECATYSLSVQVKSTKESSTFSDPDVPETFTEPEKWETFVLAAGEDVQRALQSGSTSVSLELDLTKPVNLTMGLWDENPSGQSPGMAGSGIIFFSISVNDTSAVKFPIRVTIQFPDWVTSDMDVQAIIDLVRIVTWDETKNQWVEEDFKVTADMNAQEITIEVEHLSVFALGKKSSSDGSSDTMMLDIPGYSSFFLALALLGTVGWRVKKHNHRR